jgi:hypothetical protein
MAKEREGKGKKKFWRKYHRYVGLIFSLFLIMFCISGVILNHRTAVSSIDVNRNLLPSSYKIQNYNNGIIKATLKYKKDSILCYGVGGCVVGDKNFQFFRTLNGGFDEGIDNKKVNGVIISKDSTYYSITQYNFYKLINDSWHKIPLRDNKERLSDLTLKGDSIIILSRSKVFIFSPKDNKVTSLQLTPPTNYKNKTTLFKLVWLLHSGALFGTVGKVVVDLIAIIITLLCVGGIIHFFLPYSIKRKTKKNIECGGEKAFMRNNLKLHRKVGLWTIVLTIFITLTGMSLRPPLMVPLVLNKINAIKSVATDSKNPFFDKLRAIRWDEGTNSWLISTSEGWYRARTLDSRLQKIDFSPYISPMGVNIFEKDSKDNWIIGSFAGIVRWNTKTNEIKDYFTNKDYVFTRNKRPVGNVMASGYSTDIEGKGDVIFTYDKGSLTPIPEMSKTLQKTPISLWNLALEVHTGRIYSFFLGQLNSMYVFLSGVIVILILVSGIIIIHKRK